MIIVISPIILPELHNPELINSMLVNTHSSAISNECYNSTLMVNRDGNVFLKYYKSQVYTCKKTGYEVKETLYNVDGVKIFREVTNLTPTPRSKVPVKYSYKRFDNKLRSLKRFNNYCDNNNFTHFITLTYNTNNHDYDKAMRDLNSWLTIIRRNNPNCSYLGTYEFQKRGALHFHLLMANVDNSIYSEFKKNKEHHYIKYWNHGFTDVKIVTSSALMKYTAKYIVKSNDKIWGKRLYYCSQNLKSAIEYKLYINDDLLQYIIDVASANNHQISVNTNYHDNFIHIPFRREYARYNFNYAELKGYSLDKSEEDLYNYYVLTLLSILKEGACIL